MHFVVRMSRLLLIAAAMLSAAQLVAKCGDVDDEAADSSNNNNEATILSESRNFTVNFNDTIVLPCVIRNSPLRSAASASANTPPPFVIWNQCEDAACNQLRITLTINKENFVEDLRFRVITEGTSSSAFNDSTTSSAQSQSQHHHQNNHRLFYSRETVKRQQQQQQQQDERASVTNVDDSSVNNWNLEIRRFSKADQACYQCQLNTARIATIHYCLKLKAKVIAESRKVTVRLNEPLSLKCISEENVRLSNVKWFHNGHQVLEETESGEVLIEKKMPLDYEQSDHPNIFSTSLIKKHATFDDSGFYTCKFGHLSEKIQVEVSNGSEYSFSSSDSLEEGAGESSLSLSAEGGDTTHLLKSTGSGVFSSALSSRHRRHNHHHLIFTQHLPKELVLLVFALSCHTAAAAFTLIHSH